MAEIVKRPYTPMKVTAYSACGGCAGPIMCWMGKWEHCRVSDGAWDHEITPGEIEVPGTVEYLAPEAVVTAEESSSPVLTDDEYGERIAV